MRILHVTPLYAPSPGGAERHCQEVAERLAARGHEVRVLTTNARAHAELMAQAPGSLPPSERLNGVAVTRVPTADDGLFRLLQTWTALRGGWRSASAVFSPSGLDMLLLGRPRNRRLVRAILGAPADVVLTWNWVLPAAYHAYLARRLRRFRLVGVPLFHTEEPWAQRPIYDQMLAACEGLIVNTAHEADFVRRRVPAAGPIAAIGPGVRPEPFARADGAGFRRRHGLGAAPLVGFVGRLCTGKGVPTLLQAMQRVWRTRTDVRLVLAGYTWERETPEALLAVLTPAERERVLLLTDFAEAQKADLYGAIDCFAMPSVAESFGIAYLEAWLCGKPVVGARIGSTRCVIDDGADGLTAMPGDPGELAGAIQGLLADPERRRRMGERGRAKTLANFTWEAVTTRVEQFCAMLGGARTPRAGDPAGAALPDAAGVGGAA